MSSLAKMFNISTGNKNIYAVFKWYLGLSTGVPGKKFGNFLAQNLILPGTLAFYRIVNISNDQQMSLIITLP